MQHINMHIICCINYVRSTNKCVEPNRLTTEGDVVTSHDSMGI